MAKSKQDIRILLLQIREDEETMLEEFYEFVQFSRLHEDQFTKLNTYKTADFEPTVIDEYDALFIGGSSDATVLDPDEYKFIHNCKRLVRYCYDNNIPTFASCFGFQIAVEELGGKVELDKANMEMGMYQIHLTDEAKTDVLMGDLPNSFWAVSGHKERAVSLPKDCDLLAHSEICPYHAIKFHDKPFYGFQFHPEIDRKDLLTRIARYQERYIDDNNEMQRIIDGAIHETAHANNLVRKFVERIIL